MFLLQPALLRAAEAPLLVVMSPTGTERHGLPVYTRHRNGAAYESVLRGGFSGHVLRLYRWEQQLRAKRDGTAVEPAYLLISRNEGGFPRVGFWLDAEKKADVGYVDLHERLDGSGRFGALDQIFPHELMHVIVHQLAGPPPPGASGANQVHAVGVRTDRVTAFDEGFAEHAQVMAIDDPDVRPLTAALRTNASLVRNADIHLARYQRALDAHWSLAPPARVSFITWFSQTEQVLRYHAVKANRFARDPDIRLRRWSEADLYAAYLLENILPGPQNGPFKSTPRLLSTEGVVATLFSRWMNDPVMQRPAQEPTLYAGFGLHNVVVAPIEHAYLKLFTVLADRRPHDVATLVTAYASAFPQEADAVAVLMHRTGFMWPLPEVPELWMANDRFKTGTTMFDQYRALPRIHTFDLNAASLVDLMIVEGVSLDLARAIAEHAPYATLAHLEQVPGMTPALAGRFREMHEGMAVVRGANATQDLEALDLARLLRPVIIRAVVWTLAAAFIAAGLYGIVRRLHAWRLALNGLGAAVVSLIPAWILGAALQIGDRPVESTWFVVLPIVLFGVPAALWQLIRHRSTHEARRVLAAWSLACLPTVLVTTPLG